MAKFLVVEDVVEDVVMDAVECGEGYLQYFQMSEVEGHSGKFEQVTDLRDSSEET